MTHAKSLLQVSSMLALLLATPTLNAFGGASVFQSFSLKIPRFSLVHLEQTRPVFHFAKGQRQTEIRTRVSVTSNDPQATFFLRAQTLPAGITLRIRDGGQLCQPGQTTHTPHHFSCPVGIKALWEGELIVVAERDAQVTAGAYAAHLDYRLGH